MTKARLALKYRLRFDVIAKSYARRTEIVGSSTWAAGLHEKRRIGGDRSEPRDDCSRQRGALPFDRSSRATTRLGFAEGDAEALDGPVNRDPERAWTYSDDVRCLLRSEFA